MSDEQKTAADIEKELITKFATTSSENEPVVEVSKKTKKIKLGIHNLNKSRKQKVMLAGIFLLLLAAVSVYSFPGILRMMFSDEKPVADNSLTISKNTRLTDLNKESAFDPKKAESILSGEKPNETNTGDTDAGKVKPPEKIIFSRSLAVSNGSSSSSGKSGGQGNTQEPRHSETEQKQTAGNISPNLTEKIRILDLNPDLFIPENTAIPCSLDRRFVSTLSGKLTCTVNTDIYSASGNVKLIEKGTGATLMYKSGTLNHGQGRAFLIATKLRTRTTPFIEIPLVDSEAAGALGEAGIDGWIDSHFWERFGGAMMLGMIPDAMQGFSEAAKGNKDNNTDYTANSRQAFAEIARSSFENSVGIPPTLYKNQGEIITLITGQDLDFSGIYRLRMEK